MRRDTLIMLLAACALALTAEGSEKQTETFVWKRGPQIIGRLSVPKGSRVEIYDYLEGIVTTLRYQDGASIKLQDGLMYILPLFSAPKYRLISSTEGDTKTTRVGRCGNGKLNWREDNYKTKTLIGEPPANVFTWPTPNIGYANVSSDRKSEFDNALDSFAREPEKGHQ